MSNAPTVGDLLLNRPPTGLLYNPKCQLDIRFDKKGSPIGRSILGGANLYEAIKQKKEIQKMAEKEKETKKLNASPSSRRNLKLRSVNNSSIKMKKVSTNKLSN